MTRARGSSLSKWRRRHSLVFVAPMGLSACAFWEVSSWSDRQGLDASTASTADAGVDGIAPDAGVEGDAEITIARDDFSRTVPNGFGVAPVGGAWAVAGSTAPYSVADGRAAIRMAVAGGAVTAWLGQVSTTDVDMQVVLATDTLAVGGSGLYLGLLARKLDGGNDYSGRVIMRADGQVTVSVARNESGVETVLPGAVSALTALPGESIRARFHVMGVSPTRLRIKAWKATGPEPAAWAVDAMDSAGVLQVAGNVGLRGYVSAATTSLPIVVSFDDLLVRPASRL